MVAERSKALEVKVVRQNPEQGLLPSTICHLVSAVYCLRSTLYCRLQHLLPTICRLLSTKYNRLPPFIIIVVIYYYYYNYCYYYYYSSSSYSYCYCHCRCQCQCRASASASATATPAAAAATTTTIPVLVLLLHPGSHAKALARKQIYKTTCCSTSELRHARQDTVKDLSWG